MYKQFICDRITELRMRDDISEYQLSFNLGKSKSYIQTITSGKSLPSLSGLLELCEYFKITPYEFFSSDLYPGVSAEKLLSSMEHLDIENLSETVKFLATLKEMLKNTPTNKT